MKKYVELGQNNYISNRINYDGYHTPSKDVKNKTG